MKIIFIASSLEPGRDGAGDQIRRLAAEMKLIGHECAIIALNDRKISAISFDSQQTLNVEIPTLRLPATWSAKRRFSEAKKYIAAFDPSWVSLHFVNFGYNPYGLPTEMITSFRQILGNAKLSIMFWELWCGMNNSTTSKKTIFLGFLQKMYIRMMLHKMKPENIAASTTYYIRHLKKIGIQSQLVKVIGNIPLDEHGTDEEWNELSKTSGLDQLPVKNDSFVVGFFGSFYFCPGLDQLIIDASEYAAQVNKKFVVITIGKGGGYDVEAVVAKIPEATHFRTGMIEPGMINRTMALVDAGIVTSAANGITKSSSAVAWSERGIPIIISKEDRTFNEDEMTNLGAYQLKAPQDLKGIILKRGERFTKTPITEVLEFYSSLDI